MGSLRNGAIRARILIWGAPGSGKTTTLQHVGSKLKSNQKGEIKKVTLKNPACNYELLPVELGDVKGVPTKLDFQTCPGAWEHVAVRKRMLQGVDGIVFVASSIGSAMKDNQKSLLELDEALRSMGRSLVTVPVVFQWMNQKAIGSIPTDEMHAKLNKVSAQTFAVPAEDPSGMLKSFAAISKMAVKVVRDDYDAGKLTEPEPFEIDLDSLAPPPRVPDEGITLNDEPELNTDGLSGFEDLAGDLADDLGDDFGELEAIASGSRPPTAPTRKAPAASVEVDDDDFDDEEDPDLDALLGGPSSRPPAAVKAVPSQRTNGAAKFKLVHAGEPTLSPDGTLALPIRIGNEHGEEVAMTISVKVIPEGR